MTNVQTERVVPDDTAVALPTDAAGRAPLHGRHVLVDTFNLRLQHGSGIKTYGLTLLDALRDLGGTISLLGDRAVGSTRDAALAEVLFYDHPPVRNGLGRFLDRFKRGARHISGRVMAREIRNDFVVPDQPIRTAAGIEHLYNAPSVYEAANHLFKRVRRFSTVRVPDKVDIWHATTVLPVSVKGARMVTTIHDVIPLRLPYTTLDDKKFFYRMTKDVIDRSDLVLTVSECSKRDLLKFFNVDEQKIVVTYQTIPFGRHAPDERAEHALLKRYGLKPGKYVLFVGNIEPKKNVLNAIRGVSSLIESDLSLVIVGRKGWLWEEQLGPAEASFGKKAYKKRFHLLDYIPNNDLHALYANAFCFLFPSLYEGFGLPPLEAMAHGCPTIVSDCASLPEVCGNASLYVDPREPDMIRARIEELANSEKLRDQLRTRGYERLEFFGSQRYARRLGDAYARVLS